MEPHLIPVVFLAVAAAFLLSASAGFGGSLILVPTLALVLGTKSGGRWLPSSSPPTTW